MAHITKLRYLSEFAPEAAGPIVHRYFSGGIFLLDFVDELKYWGFRNKLSIAELHPIRKFN